MVVPLASFLAGGGAGRDDAPDVVAVGVDDVEDEAVDGADGADAGFAVVVAVVGVFDSGAFENQGGDVEAEPTFGQVAGVFGWVLGEAH